MFTAVYEYRPGSWCGFLILMVAFQLLINGVAYAQLNADDEAALTAALETLSQGWDGTAASEANKYLGRADVTTEEWIDFFQDFFDARPVTQDVSTYLAYPTFHWFGDPIKKKLQIATSWVLQAKLDSLAKAAGGYEGNLLNDSSLRESVVSIHHHMHRVINIGVSDEAKEQTYEYYKDHIESHREVLRKVHTIDSDRFPYFGAIRAQIYMNLRDAVRYAPERKDELTVLLGLDDPSLERYRAVWQAHDVLIIDNNQADDRQAEVIGDLLRLTPPALHDLGTIRMRDFLGFGAKDFSFRQKHGVNIFVNRVGSRSENGFPHDISALPADQFTIVVVHEVNHVVDAFYINGDEKRKKRKDQLLADAGTYSYHYLRSHLADGFFQKAPQEFFASISNQYFVSSRHTLDLGISRFKRGFRHPLNQFLFFADIYSLDSDSTYFYTIDLQGNISRETIALRRDSLGRITELQVAEGEVYRFTLNDKGNVTAIDTAEQLTSREMNDVPERFALRQNYPNPFNPVTTIAYTVSEATSVTLEVTDVLGRRVASLVTRDVHPPGDYEVSFEAAGLPSGTYFYRLDAGGRSITRPMHLVK